MGMPVWMVGLLLLWAIVATVIVYLMGRLVDRSVRRLEWVRGYLRCPGRVCKHYARKCNICVRRSCIDMF
jgi:hypothetical protein